MLSLRDQPHACLGFVCVLLIGILTARVAEAELKIITAEATYTMGDGESPSFAEAMVLQKAKQMALEQAGTYVESYTKIKNYDLTHEEVQTIAGGVLEVEVLETTRTLVGDGLRFSIKIKATVTTDKMEELAKRIKGKNVVEDYRKLQEEYARLSKEIDVWKELVAKTPAGPDREAALEQIREREKAFSVVQKSEATLFERLVSGQALFAQAMGQLSKKQNERAIVDALFEKLLEQGYVIDMGEPSIHATLQDPEVVDISVQVTVSPSDFMKLALRETARSLGGKEEPLFLFRSRTPLPYRQIEISHDPETRAHFDRRVNAVTLVLDWIGDIGSVLSCVPDYSSELSLFHHEEVGLSPSSAERVLVLDNQKRLDFVIRVSLSTIQRIQALRGRFIEDRSHSHPRCREGERR